MAELARPEPRARPRDPARADPAQRRAHPARGRERAARPTHAGRVIAGEPAAVVGPDHGAGRVRGRGAGAGAPRRGRAASSTRRWPRSPSASALASPDRARREPRPAPRMAVHRSGRGPDLVLFHGGMGSWKHWIRNVGAARGAVHRARARPSLLRRLGAGAARDHRPRSTSTWCTRCSSRPSRARRRSASRASRSAPPSRPSMARRLGSRVSHLCDRLARRLPRAQVRRAADPQLQGGGRRRSALPRDLPPQPAGEHAER